jgi:flagellar hook-associated protein 1 FlgK
LGSLFTTLLNSTGALQVYGRVFNVIQNNITNANTPGYARRQQSIVSLPFDPASGLTGGIIPGPMLSARSQYLEQAVRNNQEQLGASQQKAADLAQVSALIDVSGNSGVPAALDALFGSFSQLSVNPNDAVSRQNVINAAGQVAQAFQQAAIGIGRVSANVDDATRSNVANMNQLASQIASINQHLRSAAEASQDAGLDAQLNTALESLSQLVHYTTVKASDGTYSIFIGGQAPLVIGAHAYSVSADFSAPQTVIRDANGNDITALLTNKGGSLGALLEEKNATLPGYGGSLNALAQTLADTVNTALAQGLDQNGNPPAVNLFTYNAALGSAYTLAVTSITPDQIAAAAAGAPGGNGNAIALSQLGSKPTVNGATFIQAFGNLGGQIGRDLAQAQQDAAAQKDLVTLAQQQRADASGVDLNEEAAKLLQFQQAYQAVGKLVTVLDSLTQTVLNMVQ